VLSRHKRHLPSRVRIWVLGSIPRRREPVVRGSLPRTGLCRLQFLLCEMHSASCRMLQAGSLRSPERHRHRPFVAWPWFIAIWSLLATSPATFAEIKASDCASAAKYSESRRGSGMLVMQNGRTIFEHYANGGFANRRWPIFSGTKSFWGIAALAAAREGLFRLDERVSDTITEWKNDPRK